MVSFPVQYVIVPFGGLFSALAARTFAPETLAELPPPLLLLLLLLPPLLLATAAAASARGHRQRDRRNDRDTKSTLHLSSSGFPS